MAVIEILNLIGRLLAGVEAFKVVKALVDFGALIDACVIQSHYARGTTGKGTIDSFRELIVVASVWVVAFSDVLRTAIDRILGYMDASVAGCS